MNHNPLDVTNPSKQPTIEGGQTHLNPTTQREADQPNNAKAIIDAAIDYSRRGWSVIPVGADKKPVVKGWKSRQLVRTEPADVPNWFAKQKGVAGVGIICGDVSGGLYVRDFDDADAYQRWAAAHPEHAATMPTVKTSRGFHLYGRWKGVRTTKGDDGELRGQGAYVCAPPTLHASGTVYAWLVPLPAGDIPEVDPARVGLTTKRSDGACATESTENTEKQRHRDDGGNGGNGGNRDTEAISEAIEFSDLDEDILARIEDAIKRTQPPAFGRRNWYIFKFARALKGIPKVGQVPQGRISVLRRFVSRWHQLALPNILTKDFGTTWGDFVKGWSRVHTPEGEDVLAKAMERAEAASAPPWSIEYTPSHRLLAALCRELQRMNGANPFFITNQLAATLLGVDKGTANRWFHAMVGDGALEVVERHSNGRATRYRYIAPDLHENNPPDSTN